MDFKNLDVVVVADVDAEVLEVVEDVVAVTVVEIEMGLAVEDQMLVMETGTAQVVAI